MEDRITCVSPAKEKAIDHFLSAPIEELADELLRMGQASYHHRCADCMAIGLRLSGMRLKRISERKKEEAERALEAMAQ